MASFRALPVIENRSPARSRRRKAAPARAVLPRLVWRDRTGPVLHANPISNDPSVLSLNLAQGCVHRCAFCSVRGHAGYEGDESIHVYRDTVRQLELELAKRSMRPRAVVISPSCDPFAPVLGLQEETLEIVRLLARQGIESWLMTRGWIRPRILAGLVAHRSAVRIRMGFVTQSRALQRALEPLTAPPRMRIRQVAALRQAGIPVEVALEPLLPGITDTRANVGPLLEALSKAGIGRVSAGYAFLRTGIRANLEQAAKEAGSSLQELDEAYKNGPIMTSGLIAAGRYLPRIRRQRGYAMLMSLAEEYGMRLSVCQSTNPDFQPAHPRPAASRPGLPLLALLADAGHAG
jgi:DNA repair photolyase